MNRHVANVRADLSPNRSGIATEPRDVTVSRRGGPAYTMRIHPPTPAPARPPSVPPDPATAAEMDSLWMLGQAMMALEVPAMVSNVATPAVRLADTIRGLPDDHKAVAFASWTERRGAPLASIRRYRKDIADGLAALDGLLAEYDASQAPGVRRIK